MKITTAEAGNLKKLNKVLNKRYFIELPAGQTGMNIKLTASKNEYARIRYFLFDPDGKSIDVTPSVNTLDGKNEVQKKLFQS